MLLHVLPSRAFAKTGDGRMRRERAVKARRLAFCGRLAQNPRAGVEAPVRAPSFGDLSMSSFAELRRMMVDCQLRTYDVTDRAVLAAADTVPREAFLPGELSYLAYLDRQEPLPGTSRALPAPMVTARMIQVLDLQPGEEALEYGGGSGYGAALMAAMGAKTTLLEPDEAALALARTAFAQPGVAPAELVASLAEHRKFDAILVSGACEVQPEPLFRHVRQGGRLIVIEGVGRSARVVLYRKAGESLSGRPVFDAAAPVLREFRKAEVFAL